MKKGVFKHMFALLSACVLLSLPVRAGDTAPSNIVDQIDATILISVTASTFNNIPLHPMPDRLRYLINNYDLGNIKGKVQKGTSFQFAAGGGATLPIGTEWTNPLVFVSTNLPPVKFRNGVIGIVSRAIFVEEGTEALVENTTYLFSNGTWKAQPAEHKTK